MLVGGGHTCFRCRAGFERSWSARGGLGRTTLAVIAYRASGLFLGCVPCRFIVVAGSRPVQSSYSWVVCAFMLGEASSELRIGSAGCSRGALLHANAEPRVNVNGAEQRFRLVTQRCSAISPRVLSAGESRCSAWVFEATSSDTVTSMFSTQTK